MPNSVVKRNSADGSVGLPHVRVGHRQASNLDMCIERHVSDEQETVYHRVER